MKKITEDEILFYQNMFTRPLGMGTHCMVSYFNLNFKNRTQKKLSLQNLELNFQKQKGD